MAEDEPQPDSPYCSNCKYPLAGLVESSKCPECGKPIVEVLTRRSQFAESGKRYRSTATLFGLPVVDIAIGPKHGEPRGKARGIIAIGDVATGWLAIGGMARGIVAIGGFAIGGFSLGGFSLGALTSAGGFALGGVLAAGGGAIGGLAAGGGAAGFIAQGGGAAGYYARGGGVWGVHVAQIPPMPSSPQATSMFDQLSWFFGGGGMNAVSMMQPMVIVALVAVAAAGIVALIAMLASRRNPAHQADWMKR